MRIVYNRYIPFKGFAAINLFGTTFAREESRPLSDRTICHESIHTKQMKETGWVGFYVIYLIEFLIRLAKTRNALRAYYDVYFEREAYAHQSEENYLLERPAYAWIGHARADVHK